MNPNGEEDSDRRPLALRAFGWIGSLAGWMSARAISPNAISVAGIVVGALCGLVLAATAWAPESARWLWLLVVLLMFARVLANTLDGMVAVEHGKATRVGLLYNEAPDRLTDLMILIGAGYAAGSTPEFGYLAASTAVFVAYVRALAKNAGAPSDFGGPMNKKGRVLTISATALYMAISPAQWQPAWGPGGTWGLMSAALLLICLGGIYTAALRLRRAGRHLRAQEP
jgi:phosphatidylglycerophosphate synthase